MSAIGVVHSERKAVPKRVVNMRLQVATLWFARVTAQT